MRITTALFVLPLAAAIGMSLTTQDAQAFSVGHLSVALQGGMLAKPPSGNKSAPSNKTPAFVSSNKSISFVPTNKTTSLVSSNKTFTSTKPMKSSSCYSGSHCFSCYNCFSCCGWYNWYNCYNCFGCCSCYSPFSLLRLVHVLPDP